MSLLRAFQAEGTAAAKPPRWVYAKKSKKASVAAAEGARGRVAALCDTGKTSKDQIGTAQEAMARILNSVLRGVGCSFE